MLSEFRVKGLGVQGPSPPLHAPYAWLLNHVHPISAVYILFMFSYGKPAHAASTWPP